MKSLPHSTWFKRLFVMAFDAVLVSSALYLSYALRFGNLQISGYQGQFLAILPLVVVTRLALFSAYGLYQGMWRFVGVHDMVTIVKATTVGSVVIVSVLFFSGRLLEFPRSIFIISWFIVLVLVGGSRFAYRLYREFFSHAGRQNREEAKNVLIIGAGSAGELILREILSANRSSFKPIGFVDDDRAKRNMTIHGLTVLGHTRNIPSIIQSCRVEMIIFAIAAAPAKAKRRIMMICKRTGVPVKILPGVGDVLKGSVKVSELRDFQIEDLLGRAPVRLDTFSIAQFLRNKTVLITGAGGSIGSELCRQAAKFLPRRIVLFERSEFNLYQIHMNMKELYPDLEINPVIGDVLNPNHVERTFARFMPEVIFHAAAYKHVPLMEMNPAEALRNNTLGTMLVADMARRFSVSKFVMVSTDKAVRPANMMGVSKRLAELVCEGLSNASTTQYVTVRFGNVLNSVGSVIPLFKRQIEKGGPITVTHPEIYRYFMTIPESVQLIMQAGAMGKGGEIFLLDMGEPVRIADLARDMIRLSGLEPDTDIRIEYTGLRLGEKMFEELLTDGEEVKSTLHEKIKVAGRAEVDGEELLSKLNALFQHLQINGYTQDIYRLIKDIVPEYQPENGGPGTQVTPRT